MFDAKHRSKRLDTHTESHELVQLHRGSRQVGEVGVKIYAGGSEGAKIVERVYAHRLHETHATSSIA